MNGVILLDYSFCGISENVHFDYTYNIHNIYNICVEAAVVLCCVVLKSVDNRFKH